MAAISEEQLVLLRDGPAVPVGVLRALWTFEDRGVSFEIQGELVRVCPRALLSPDEWQFLQDHRDLVRALVHYCERVPTI